MWEEGERRKEERPCPQWRLFTRRPFASHKHGQITLVSTYSIRDEAKALYRGLVDQAHKNTSFVFEAKTIISIVQVTQV